MTITARKVLHDLQIALALLQEEGSAERFRVAWVASVSLCRGVGHALHKVDSKRSLKIKLAIDAAFVSWKDDPERHHVFFEFIEDERNAVLKEYEFGFLSGAPEGLILPNGLLESLPDNLFCPMSDGRFAGVDCRDVLELAISWWQMQLQIIDDAVAA